jgi:hypothetical protein
MRGANGDDGQAERDVVMLEGKNFGTLLVRVS